MHEHALLQAGNFFATLWKWWQILCGFLIERKSNVDYIECPQNATFSEWFAENFHGASKTKRGGHTNNKNILEKQKKGVKQETCDFLVTLTWLGNHILKMNWIPAIFRKTWDNTCHLDAYYNYNYNNSTVQKKKNCKHSFELHQQNVKNYLMNLQALWISDT